MSKFQLVEICESKYGGAHRLTLDASLMRVIGLTLRNKEFRADDIESLVRGLQANYAYGPYHPVCLLGKQCLALACLSDRPDRAADLLREVASVREGLEVGGSDTGRLPDPDAETQWATGAHRRILDLAGLMGELHKVMVVTKDEDRSRWTLMSTLGHFLAKQKGREVLDGMVLDAYGEQV